MFDDVFTVELSAIYVRHVEDLFSGRLGVGKEYSARLEIEGRIVATNIETKEELGSYEFSAGRGVVGETKEISESGVKEEFEKFETALAGETDDYFDSGDLAFYKGSDAPRCSPYTAGVAKLHLLKKRGSLSALEAFLADVTDEAVREEVEQEIRLLRADQERLLASDDVAEIRAFLETHPDCDVRKQLEQRIGSSD